MKRALTASTAFFLALFALGFILGTVRVLFVAPRVGPIAATAAEVPLMLIAAYYICRRSIEHWQVPQSGTIRWTMTLWFLALLFVFETLLGLGIFGRTATEQLAALTTSAGLLGISAQILAALLPVLVRRRKQQWPT